MPFKTPINSDATRTNFLERCTMQNDNDAAGSSSLVSAPTAAAIKAILPEWKTRLQQRGKEAADRLPAAAAKDEAKATCVVWISHFFQVLHFWIRRELHDEGILKFYSTEMLSSPAMSLTTDDSVLLWGGRLLEGEKKRVDAGGPAMTNPSAEAFKPIYDLFKMKLQLLQKEKVELDEAEEAVAALRPQVDELIADAVAELEFALRKETGSAQRRKMRRYGVKYSYRPGEPEDEEPQTIDAPVQ